MELIQLTDRIYYLPHSPETDRPVLGYIRGDRFSVMVDAGNSARHVELFQKELKKRGLPSPDYVAITHWHWDHTFGMSAVEGKVISGRLTNEKLKIVMNWEWTEEAMKKRLETGEDIEFCDRCIRLEYPDRNEINVRAADLEFDSSIILDIGGAHCELRYIGGPHSDDAVSVFIPEEKVLFIGDADGGDYYYNNGEYDKKKLEAIISYLNGVDFEYYVHGHDEPQRKPVVLDYLNDELDKLNRVF